TTRPATRRSAAGSTKATTRRGPARRRGGRCRGANRRCATTTTCSSARTATRSRRRAGSRRKTTSRWSSTRAASAKRSSPGRSASTATSGSPASTSPRRRSTGRGRARSGRMFAPRGRRSIASTTRSGSPRRSTASSCSCRCSSTPRPSPPASRTTPMRRGASFGKRSSATWSRSEPLVSPAGPAPARLADNDKHNIRGTTMRTTVFGAFAAGALLAAGAAPASAQDGECDRACLEGWVDRYLDAVIDDDVDAVPFAANARFTEHGQRLELGDGLWNTMKGKGTYRLLVPDVEAGQVAFIGTIYEDHRDPAQQTPAVIALRLKIENGAITEAEQQVVRNEEAARRIEARGGPDPLFLEPVPESERMSRRELIETANMYFTGMQQNDGKGEYPFADDCNRIENGSQTTNVPLQPGQMRPDPKTATSYSAHWSCREQVESGLPHVVNRTRDLRFAAVDLERRNELAFVIFAVAGWVLPWTCYIAEVFRIENGLIRRIEATLDRVPYGMLSGWSTYEEGMSDAIQDETM